MLDYFEHNLEYINDSIDGDIYEFGTYYGNGLYNLINGYIAHNKKVNRVFGFDSFEGLPEPTAIEQQTVPEWRKGLFDIQGFFKNKNLDEIKDFLETKLQLIFPDVNLYFIRCWFNELTSEYVQKYKMGPASYVRIDCDLYSSTIDALSFMFDNHLMVPGTIINYDDIIPYSEWTMGEGLAHKEIEAKYKVQYKHPEQQIFFIESIG